MRGSVREGTLSSLVGDQADAVDQRALGRARGRDYDLVADRLILLARVENDVALAPGYALVGRSREEGRTPKGYGVVEAAGVGVRLWRDEPKISHSCPLSRGHYPLTTLPLRA